MPTIELRTLDGSNPLHFLASLGALLVTSDDDPSASLRWRLVDGIYSPILLTSLDEASWDKVVADSIAAAGRVESDPEATSRAQRTARESNKLLKSAKETLKDAAKRARARKRGSAEDAQAAVDDLAAARTALAKAAREDDEAKTALALQLGYGPAHLGDIPGVSPNIVVAHAKHALAAPVGLHPRTLEQLAAIVSDASVKDGVCQPTPYSFSNGSSGKCLLRDFRALSNASSSAQVTSWRSGSPDSGPCSGLNWDPRDLRSYAYQWQSPEKEAKVKSTDIISNALAYLGLGMLPAIPSNRGLGAVAFADRSMRWCVWAPSLEVPVVRALLATATEQWKGGEDVQRKRGILARFRSELSNPTGKRNFFAPSVAG